MCASHARGGGARHAQPFESQISAFGGSQDGIVVMHTAPLPWFTHSFDSGFFVSTLALIGLDAPILPAQTGAGYV